MLDWDFSIQNCDQLLGIPHDELETTNDSDDSGMVQMASTEGPKGGNFWIAKSAWISRCAEQMGFVV